MQILLTILYYLPYIGLAVYIIRVVVLRTVKLPTPKGKKLTDELLVSCLDQLKKHDKLTHSVFVLDPVLEGNLKICLKNHQEDIARYGINGNRSDSGSSDALNKTLNAVLSVISNHVGLNESFLKLKINSTIISDKAGEIRPDVSTAVITLDLKDNYDSDTVVSVLAHEVMHQYLFFQGIKRWDKWENEILTDTATVYAGFYNYMLKGYAPKHGVNPFSYSKVGYIGLKEIKFLIEHL